MNYVSRYDSNGRFFSVTNTTFIPAGFTTPIPPHPDDAIAAGIYPGQVNIQTQYFDIGATNTVMNIPPAPAAAANVAPYLAFDFVSKTWKDSRTLVQVQADQCALVDVAYLSAATANLAYTSIGGVAQTYQADATSQTLLLQAFTGYNAVGATPTGFYWKAVDNTPVPFVLGDLKALYQAMLSVGWTAFQHRTTQKAAINSATTVSAALSIGW